MHVFSRTLIACAFVACGSFALSETITFEADDGVVVVRTYDQFGNALVEFIGDAGSVYQCVAFNADDKPVATSPAMADVGQIIFQGIAAQEIANVKCRKLR